MLSVLTAAALWLALTPGGRAATYTYGARQRTVNAGVLFVGSAGDAVGATNPAPYIFHVLNLRTDIKQVGWSIVNPIAPDTITSTTLNRWRSTPGYTLGQQVRPDMAAYWEVPLRDTSADQLQQFDVLYLHASATGYFAQFTPADNEKLRRFVDNGGQLFVEYGGPVGTPAFFADVHWKGFNPAPPLPAVTISLAPAPALVTLHPLVSQPYPLGGGDLHLSFLLGKANDPGTNTFGAINALPYLTNDPPATGEFANLFGSVLFLPSQAAPATAVSAGQLGAGQITVSALDIGPNVTQSQGAFFSTTSFPKDPEAAPAADLKLLTNIIAWGDTHPSENKTSHQNAAGPSAASFAPSWAYPDPATGTPLSGTTPPGAAVWGSFVFVTDAAGTLHAFDAYPDGDALGRNRADNQSPPLPSPTPYGELWSAGVGTNASAPTVGSYGGNTYVFVENNVGSVLQFKVAATGASVAALNTFTPSPAPGGFPSGSAPPAPTFYEGRIYAGQADGSLFVYDLNTGASANGGALVPMNPNSGGSPGTAEAVTASPAVGLLASGDTTNSIVALVPTTQALYTALLGARNDPLVAYTTNGQTLGYNVNRNGRFGIFNLFVDTASVPAARIFDGNGNVLASPASGGQDPVFSVTTEGIYYGDWDVDFRQSISSNGGGGATGTLTLHSIKAQSLGSPSPPAAPAFVSAPAIDRKGDYYYVVSDGPNSYLFGVHDDIVQRNVRIKFRFRLPISGDPSGWNGVDADNVNYNDTQTKADGSANSLLNFRFVGTPVADAQGNVYIAASNGTNGAVLCFNANQSVTADGGTGFDATQASYSQVDEVGGQPNPIVAQPATGSRYGQVSTAGSVLTILNFGRGSGAAKQIAGNLTEPQPITVTPNGGQGTALNLHTNLAWYTTFNLTDTRYNSGRANTQISGLSKAGNTLMLVGSGGPFSALYKLPAAPTVGAGKVVTVPPLTTALGTGLNGKPLDLGAVSAAPSAGGGAMVINGSKGIAAFTQQLTLIADSNRILEADADGNAVWSADATTRDTGNGTATKVDFAHPTWLSPFAANDYLVADSGNNRCVRFDRGGKVRWELTRFYDPSGLMAPGQPTTLSQPASVEVRREPFPYRLNGTDFVGTNVHYLVADAGNDRIVEVTDTLDPNGNVLYFDANTGNVVAPGAAGSVTHDHILTWVTHTGDLSGRHYRYGAASYLNIPSATAGTPDTVEVFALVTNTRIASPSGTSLAPASADAPGGSIVAFNRPVNPVRFNQITAATPNDLVYVATTFLAQPTGQPVRTYPVRNPRFLHVFAPLQGAVANAALYAYSFLYADDNGAFDLVFQPPVGGKPAPPVSYGLAFTQDDYGRMTSFYNIAADVPGNVPKRSSSAAGVSPATYGIPFVPTCVQRLNDDDTNTQGTAHITRYLITQSYSQGELGRAPRPQNAAPIPYKIGGEIFEVDVTSNGTTQIVNVPVGGFGAGVTLSRPVSANPLTQPTSAVRTAQ